MQEIDPSKLRAELSEIDALAKANAWLARGDGIAVYENADFGSAGMGDRQFVSFGSADAMLEVETPPTWLPDIGNQINWRFVLFGVYRGAPL